MKTFAYILIMVVLGWMSQFASAQQKIKIGIVAELSGANSDVGKNHVRGAQLAIDEINQQGGVLGKMLELVIEDNQGTNPGSLLALNQLKSKYELSALITPNRSTQILSMMKALEQLAIPTFIGGTDFALTQMNNPWIFRMRPHDGYSAKAMAKFGVEQLKGKKWAILYSSDTFGIDGKKYLLAELAKVNITPVLVQSINLNAQDYNIPLTMLKQSDADILATYLIGPSNSGRFATQLKETGLRVNWLASSALGTASALKFSNGNSVGAYVFLDFSVDLTKESHRFSKTFFNKHHELPDYYASWTYDAVKLFAKAVLKNNSVDSKKLQSTLLSIQDYQGTNGSYRFDKQGDGLHTYSVFQIKPTKLELIKTFQFDQ